MFGFRKKENSNGAGGNGSGRAVVTAGRAASPAAGRTGGSNGYGTPTVYATAHRGVGYGAQALQPTEPKTFVIAKALVEGVGIEGEPFGEQIVSYFVHNGIAIEPDCGQDGNMNFHLRERNGTTGLRTIPLPTGRLPYATKRGSNLVLELPPWYVEDAKRNPLKSRDWSKDVRNLRALATGLYPVEQTGCAPSKLPNATRGGAGTRKAVEAELAAEGL